MIRVKIRRSKGCHDLPLPAYQTDNAAGMDVYAAVKDDVIIPPHEARLIPAGFHIEIPPGYEAQIRPRSGLALNHRIAILNSPGTIDSDFRGAVGIILFNLGEKAFTVRRGDRIAQMVFGKIERAELVAAPRLSSTRRGRGGFGHTGRR
jgi:dUTP pyrophosphatase